MIPQGESTLADDADFIRKLDETAVQLEAIQFTEFRMMAALSKVKAPDQSRRCLKRCLRKSSSVSVSWLWKPWPIQWRASTRGTDRGQ